MNLRRSAPVSCILLGYSTNTTTSLPYPEEKSRKKQKHSPPQTPDRQHTWPTHAYQSCDASLPPIARSAYAKTAFVTAGSSASLPAPSAIVTRRLSASGGAAPRNHVESPREPATGARGRPLGGRARRAPMPGGQPPKTTNHKAEYNSLSTLF